MMIHVPGAFLLVNVGNAFKLAASQEDSSSLTKISQQGLFSKSLVSEFSLQER